MTIAIAVHGGVGNSISNIDGCVAAASAGMAELAAGNPALDSALAAAVVLENDERFNAGTGSSLRLDGETIEMDAGIMDSRGRLGAVAGIMRVKNPVLVARAVADTPHWMLAGEGATAFARRLGFADYDPMTDRARRAHRAIIAKLAARGVNPASDERALKVERCWNFGKAWEEVIKAYGSSTIGVVARDSDGHYAVCASTGGASVMLRGRVGDTPIVGCGFYAGRHGAVAATGIGEEIVKTLLAHTVYRWIEVGASLAEALDRGVALYPASTDIGLIAVGCKGAAANSNRQMPSHSIVA